MTNWPWDGPNIMNVTYGLRDLRHDLYLHNKRPYIFFACILLKAGAAAICIVDLSLTPIFGSDLCKSFDLRLIIEENYLSGILGIYVVITWSYLFSMTVWLV